MTLTKASVITNVTYMLIDYSDPNNRHYLLTKIKIAIQSQVESEIYELQDDSLVGSKLTSAIGEVLDYLDEHLVIKFKD